jgi:DNA-binding transcriptional ArsR family regulator
VKALAHPVRVRILAALERRTASPRELAEELDVSLGVVSYHVRQLAGAGLIRLVKEARRRGAVEHYYQLDRRPSIREKAWADAPDFVKQALAGAVLAEVAEEVNAAVESGGFTHEDMHLSRLPLTLDKQGFAEADRELAALAERLRTIEQDSRRRLERSNHSDETVALAVLMLFEAAEKAAAGRGPSSRSRYKAQRSRSRGPSPTVR